MSANYYLVPKCDSCKQKVRQFEIHIGKFTSGRFLFNALHPTGKDWKRMIERSSALIYNDCEDEVSKKHFLELIENGKFLKPLKDSNLDEEGYHISIHEDFC